MRLEEMLLFVFRMLNIASLRVLLFIAFLHCTRRGG
jgi:hypothetical protein